MIFYIKMEGITKPSLTRLARRAGVKSLSEDCFDTVRNLIGMKLSEVLKIVSIVNSEHQTKTIMASDIYEALHLLNYNVTQSNDLNVSK
jgi:histone H3/H4